MMTRIKSFLRGPRGAEGVFFSWLALFSGKGGDLFTFTPFYPLGLHTPPPGAGGGDRERDMYLR